MSLNKINFSKDHRLLKDIVIESGKIAIKWFKNKPRVWKKKDGTEVSEADLEVNDFLHKELKDKLPKTGWLSEETKDDYLRLNFKKTLIIDPIDGTKSFLNGKKDFSISIALIESGKPISAFIYNPANKELYEAEKNKGSWLNSKKITTTNTKVIDNCKMCAFKPMFSHPAWKRPWPKMQIKNKNSIAYRMALVSCGKFDSMMALNRKSDWDVAAGDLLISEAGGKVTDHKGNQLIYNLKDTSKKSIIGSCMGLHDKIVSRVKELDL